MKYSVIIPTLNEEKLLPNLLLQLNEKTFRDRFDIEIIISDGGSKDRTKEIALENSAVLKVHSEDHRQNIAEGRNEGAKFASGDILVFINADIVFPDIVFFFSYVEKYFTGGDYKAMTCNVKIFPDEEILLDKLYHTCYNKYFKLLNSIRIGMGRGECQIIWKDIFNIVNGYNQNLAAGEDFDLFRRIRKHGKILFADEICIYESPRRYRKFGYGGVTWSWIKNSFSILLKNKSLSKEWEQVR